MSTDIENTLQQSQLPQQPQQQQQQQQQQQPQQPMSSLTKLLHESTSTLASPVLSRNTSEVTFKDQGRRTPEILNISDTVDAKSPGITIDVSKPKPSPIDTDGMNVEPQAVHGFDPSPNTKVSFLSPFSPTSPFTRQSSNSFSSNQAFQNTRGQLLVKIYKEQFS